MDSMHKQMQGILKVLTPMQQAKFMMWIEEGMSGRGLISTVRKILEINSQEDFLTDDSQSLSLSDLESLGSLSSLYSVW